MDRNDFIKQCRYYKGEKENPFDKKLSMYEVDKSHLLPPECMCTEYSGTDQKEIDTLKDKRSFWEYERCWVDFSLSDKDYLSHIVVEYKEKGLSEYKKNDGTPISLKAILFNRYRYWHDDYSKNVIEDYKEWFNNY